MHQTRITPSGTLQTQSVSLFDGCLQPAIDPMAVERVRHLRSRHERSARPAHGQPPRIQHVKLLTSTAETTGLLRVDHVPDNAHPTCWRTAGRRKH
jgi:hypothetical protein